MILYICALALALSHTCTYAQHDTFMELPFDTQEPVPDSEYQRDSIDLLIDTADDLPTPTFNTPSAITVWIKSSGLSLLQSYYIFKGWVTAKCKYYIEIIKKLRYK